jgi:hypothetical protein
VWFDVVYFGSVSFDEWFGPFRKDNIQSWDTNYCEKEIELSPFYDFHS